MNNKKIQMHKTLEERVAIVDSIKRQFSDLGIDIETFEALKQLKDILKEYQIESIVSGFSGKFYVPEINRHVEYVLPLKKMTNGYVKLVA